jgi:photosystem II stability/assembly factor-like uncharacterized protein
MSRPAAIPTARRVALVSALVVLISACGSSGHGPASDPAASPTAGGTTPVMVEPDGPVPTGFVPTSATFVSADQGFVLGAVPCASLPSPPAASGPCPSLAKTGDGGRTWRRRPAPPTTIHSSDPTGDASQVSRVRFGDPSNGWAFGPGLWSTHDGAGTWHAIDLGGVVTDLASSAGVTYALVTHCDSRPCGQGATLYRTDNAADDWHAVEGVTLTPTGGTISLHGRAVWIVGRSIGPGQSLLSASADGADWTTRPDLCGADASLTGVAPVSALGLFVLCGDSPGAGSEPKRVLWSTDGGASAQPVAAMPPSSGIADAIVAADDRVVVVSAASGASWIYRTADAGATWATALTSDDATQVFSDLGFTTATQGFVVQGHLQTDKVGGTQLLMTRDAGATWVPVTFG